MGYIEYCHRNYTSDYWRPMLAEAQVEVLDKLCGGDHVLASMVWHDLGRWRRHGLRLSDLLDAFAVDQLVPCPPRAMTFADRPNVEEC